jgi:hypothetical protein
MGVVLEGYQIAAMDKVKAMLGVKPVVLAAAPNSGKTEMAIHLVEETLRDNPEAKILILAHGTVVLKDQFYERIKDKLPGQVKNLDRESDIDDTPVLVAIPQAFKMKKSRSFDLLIVDEAHHFYFAPEYQKMLARFRCKKTLLLTGTHFKFTRRNNEAEDRGDEPPFFIEMLTINEIMEHQEQAGKASQYANLKVLVCQSKYDFRVSDYNSDGNIKGSYNFKKEDTVSTVGKVLHKLLGDLYPSPSTVQRLEKTMFACAVGGQVWDVYNYLKSIGVKVRISVCDEGEDGVAVDTEEITKFVKNPEDQALVVMYRGVLGFNHPGLVNVVDLTGTDNLERIYQLMCRAVRRFDNPNQADKQKYFIKCGPKNSGGHEYTLHLMTAALQLNDRHWYSKFDGHNFLRLPIPTIRGKTKSTTTRGRGSKAPKPRAKPRFFLDVMESDLMFEGTSGNVLDSALYTAGHTTLGKAREVLLGARADIGEITVEDVIFMATTGKDLTENPNRHGPDGEYRG